MWGVIGKRVARTQRRSGITFAALVCGLLEKHCVLGLIHDPLEGLFMFC